MHSEKYMLNSHLSVSALSINTVGACATFRSPPQPHFPPLFLSLQHLNNGSAALPVVLSDFRRARCVADIWCTCFLRKEVGWALGRYGEGGYNNRGVL